MQLSAEKKQILQIVIIDPVTYIIPESPVEIWMEIFKQSFPRDLSEIRQFVQPRNI